jgi:hypothetical protein
LINLTETEVFIMSNKTFSIAGYSKLTNGQYKARFANNTIKARTALLVRAGQTEITFLDLPEEMTKAAAAQYVLTCAQNIPPGAGVALKRALVGADEVEDAVAEVVAEVVAPKSKAKVKTTTAA